MMSDRRLDLAEALLAKAKSSPFDGERDSFAAGAYSQLAAYLGSGPVRTGEMSPGLAVPSSPIGELPGTPESTEPPVAEGDEAGRLSGDSDAAMQSGDLDEVADSDPDEGETPLVIDLRAAERAYKGSASGRARPGALIDLTI